MAAAIGIVRKESKTDFDMQPSSKDLLPLIWLLSMRRKYLRDKGYNPEEISVTAHGAYKPVILAGYPELEGRIAMVLDKCAEYTTTAQGKRIDCCAT